MKYPDFARAPQEDLRRPRSDDRRQSHQESGRVLTVYADTSFFVSLYLEDRHSKNAGQLIDSGGRVWCTPFDRVECTPAVAHQVLYKKLTASGPSTNKKPSWREQKLDTHQPLDYIVD